MRLQLLELSGFKSFPNRAELSFEQGVTAIVGPNGCGKSNLVDAITWVLGEQSAKNLRGGRMDDLIFGGSDGRRPTAAAEVRLVLKDVALEAGPNGSRALDPAHRGNGHGTSAAAPGANGGEPGTGDVGGATATATAAAVSGDLGGGADVALDEEPLRRPVARDVELARRLYRSGESEYLIDGHVCRLRDVQDLLMSAGVGVKGYAVIEQGKIGQILSARPTERRQLIEEAAGVTKFKSRRHAAELKLDAARENLARVDDIIHELERQRGALKRQSAKARRYQRLRDQLRVWETVLFASRHRLLLVTLEDAIAALAEARQQEGGVASRMERVEADLERRRADLAAREGAAATAREDAHARELDVRRHQQQIAFDRQQIESLGEAETVLAAEVEALEARRSPQQRALAEQRQVTAEVEGARDDAARRLAEAQEAHAAALRRVTSLESDVEAARGEVFSAINAATALRHAIENAAAGHDRVTEDLDRLGVEAADLALERRRASTQHADASRVLADARAALEATRDRLEHHRRDLESWRRERESAAGDVRALERRVAETEARHRSLEELAIARAGYGDAARLLLAEAQGGVPQLGSLADHVEVDREYERAVEGALDELLEHVLVRSHEAAREGIRLVRDGEAGRCGFIVVESAHGEPGGAEELHRPPEGFVSLASFVTFSGPHAAALRRVIGDFWVAPTFEAAVAVARTSSTPIVTREGDVLRGPHIVRGSGRGSSRGILSTKGEIRRLADRHAEEQRAAEAAAEALARLSARIDEADVTVASLTAELHEQEKLIVGAELQESRAKEEIDRLDRKHALIDTEQRRATEARGALEARRLEAHESIARLESDQRAADERFSLAQQRLIEARGEAERLSVAAAEAKAAHARLTERAVQGSANLSRVERAVDELEERIASRAGDRDQTRARREELVRSVAESERLLAEDRLALDHLAEIVEASDRCVAELHDECQGLEHDLRAVRRELDEARARVARLDVAHATAESDIAHLADSCTQALQASLDDVSAEVARMAEAGELPTWRPSGRGGQRDAEAGADEVGDEAAADEAAAEEAAAVEAAADEVAAAAERAVASTEFEEADADDPGAVAEQAVADLRERIERLGAINMMAIEQFDELEQRHGFMAAQRQDLVDSISTTGAAIKRIERTTRERFKEAFDQINVNLQETFATMFGGGQAGLVLLDEDDLLESGLDIIAQPPGKRLQSVQLLSGGEKALTAIALMFAIFKYRPSPFCLLDEIDAPLDDVNIGRFVEMLRSMIGHTQFILITHNRRTMEIADRLYGVTMEEPGVSKLVSVALN